MKEIIEQISRIDAVAFENEQKNRKILANEKQRLENEMKKYRDKKLSVANEKAKTIYHQTVGKTKAEYQVQEDEIKKISGQIEKFYQSVEKDIIKKIMGELFEQRHSPPTL